MRLVTVPILLAGICTAHASTSPLTSALAELYARGISSLPLGHASPGQKLLSLLSEMSVELESIRKQDIGIPSGKTTQSSIHDLSHSYFPDNGDGFYAILPEYLTSVIPGGGKASWASSCFGVNYAVATWASPLPSSPGLSSPDLSSPPLSSPLRSSPDSSSPLPSSLLLSSPLPSSLLLNISSTQKNASAPFCSDFYLFATVDALHLVTVSSAGSQMVNVSVPRSAWVAREGVRVFRFLHDASTAVLDALATISLFIPSLTQPTLDPDSQAANLKFLRDYVNITMEERGSDLIDMDWSYVRSGDLLAISRLDGLGTMEQWGTGAATTHIVMAVRLGDSDSLYMVESTSKDAYWPLDNIQLNAANTWIPMAQAAKYAVVHLPLSDAARAAWNQSAAEDFIFENVGYPYGYHNFIMTFFDTPTGNLPWPASWQLIEIIFSLLEGVDRNLTDQLLGDALNMRLGTTNLDIVQAVDLAATKGYNFGQLVSIPEQDEWVYSDGPSMVCDVFYCNIIKAAGVFRDIWGIQDTEINCREFHNLDVYRLNIFNLSSPRPQACIDADPMLPYCQIMGQYRVHLDNANTMAPYPHMNENCTALPLSYDRMPYLC